MCCNMTVFFWGFFGRDLYPHCVGYLNDLTEMNEGLCILLFIIFLNN